MLISFCVGNERHVSLYRLRFSGVTEENVDSIMRRTAVCRFKSSFVDMAKLPDMEDREKLAAAHGIFPRDPTLKDFLRDKPACLVTLRCIWNTPDARQLRNAETSWSNMSCMAGTKG